MKYYVNKNFEKSYDGKYHNFFIVSDEGAWIIHSEDYDNKYNSWRKCGEYMIIPPASLNFLKEIKEEETALTKENIEKLNFIRM